MTQARIIAVETANPALQATQAEALECVRRMPQMTAHQEDWYERFLSDKGIETRTFGLKELSQTYRETPDEAIRRFAEVGTELGARALSKALQAGAVRPGELDGLIVTTCTGYLCPGMTSYLSEQLGLRDDLFTLDLTGIGCGAAIPAVRAASQFLTGRRNSVVAVVCVEVCSAAISWGEEIDLILSNSIFSDGAACAILSNRPEAAGPAVLGFESLLWPAYRDDLRFKNRDGRLCNAISRKVPVLAAQAVDELNLRLSDILGAHAGRLAVHPGGRKILQAIERTVPGFSGKLGRSYGVLKRYGNMSSPSVLYVLRDILHRDMPDNGEKIFLFAFGAGFSAFGAALSYAPLRHGVHKKGEEILGHALQEKRKIPAAG